MENKSTGFASPAQGYEEQSIDLNRLLIQNPPATFFGRLDTSEMEELGLPYGALLVIDRSKKPVHNSIVMLRHEGQFICRLMIKKHGKIAFTNGKTTFQPIHGETEIFGTITASIKEYKNAATA